MKEDLITLDTAKLAKEKGFNFSEIEIRDSNTLKVAGNVKERLDYFETMEESNLIQLPTQALLQKWLREDHDIHIKIEAPIIIEGVWHYGLYYNDKFNKEWNLMRDAGGVGKCYEEALEKGLQEALKLIKK